MQRAFHVRRERERKRRKREREEGVKRHPRVVVFLGEEISSLNKHKCSIIKRERGTLGWDLYQQ